MKNGHAVCAILLVALMAAPVGNVLAQGSLGPPGPPGSTMVTLQQLWDAIAVAQGQLTTIDAAVGSLSNRMDGVEADLGDVNTQVGELGSAVAALSNQVVDLAVQVDDLARAQFAENAALLMITVATNAVLGEASLAFSQVLGEATIGYSDGRDSTLKAAAERMTEWDYTVADTGFTFRGISAAINSNDELMISYYAAFASTTQNLLRLARYDGSWHTETVATNAISYGDSLAFDMNKRPAIAYCEVDTATLSDTHLMYVGYDGSKWVRYTVDNVGSVGEDASAAFIGWLPAISYYDSANGDLKYAKWTGAAWTTEVVDSAGNVGKGTSLEFKPDGYPGISYYDVGNHDLKLAEWNGTTWDIQTVDYVGDVGITTSLKYGPDGFPAIAYHDGGNGDLKYAKLNGYVWDIRTVYALPIGDVGCYPSLGFTPGGRAAIVSQDLFSTQVKYIEIPAY